MSRTELLLAEMIKIGRSLKLPSLIATFEPVAGKCPFCGTSRKNVAGLCSIKCLEEHFEGVLESVPGAIEAIATKFVLKKGLHNGATIHYLNDDYRNNNLLFWDAQNNVIVNLFTALDDYGSVPPRFVVGDGYFNPDDWLNEVDHNTIVFPATSLIKEMKEFAEANPGEKQMIVTINGTDWHVIYDPKVISDKVWDSCVLEVAPAWSSGKKKFPASLTVYYGHPVWRRSIKDV